MSIEQTTQQQQQQQPALRPFRRALWLLVGGLVVACFTLVAVNLMSGPRLTSVDVDTTAVVSAANQRLVLATNRQLVEVTPDQVDIAPATDFQVTTSGNSVVISFPQPLAYNTDYAVSVRGVTGAAVDRQSSFSTEFSTSEPSLYYLSRAAPSVGADARALDRILRTTVGSTETSVAFATANIQEFVPMGTELAVVTVNDDLANALYRVDADGTAEVLNLPGVGLVHDLQAAPGQSLVGFRFTSAADAAGPRYDNVLFILDLRTNASTPVADLNGDPLSVTTWGFMANRADIVAQQYDSTMLLINPIDQSGGNPLENEPELDPPVPLGQFANLTAFAPDGVRIAVSDRDGQYVLDLSQGTESAIVPQSVAGTTRYTAELRFLAGGDGDTETDRYVQRVAEFDPATGAVRQYLSLVAGGETRTVYAPASALETIVGFEISPNDQYLAVQVVPNRDSELSDGYPENAQATDATTLFVNVATGELRRSVLGFDATWQ
ncbi:hypothetical protein E3O45_01340 [Cryobacterium sp. TMS1-20-1]|uniref:hypothetical protein n=1 Tax=Cryobacterium sp. TMS1-20-1 TaxID=1259223 RepID=UPI00106B8669|nr:hypothetical protein [Cryobacterium sp. TMS1-20-1]TFC81011.1 hypothetical protein E3O45_01340 [Cryobacterium sp. TMS1-20-1]